VTAAPARLATRDLRPSGHPHHPAPPVPLHTGHGDARAHVGAGAFRGGGQDRVQHVPPGRDEDVDPGLVLDRPADRLGAGGERHLPDGGGAAVEDLVQQAPAAQLDDAAAGQRMGGHGVAREGRLVHDHHVVPETSEQQGGGRSGDSSAHDHDVVTAAVRGLHGHPPSSGDDIQVSIGSVDRPILTSITMAWTIVKGSIDRPMDMMERSRSWRMPLPAPLWPPGR
jgi:hypothetical protein